MKSRARAVVLAILLASFQSIISDSAQADLYTLNLSFHLDASNSSSYSGTGSLWNDLSGNGRNFSRSPNAPLFVNTPPKNFQLTKTSSGGTFFSGLNSWLGGQNFTVSAWIKTTNIGTGSNHWTQMHIMSAETGSLANDWGFGVNGSGRLSFGTGGASDLTYQSSNLVNTGDWLFVTATRAFSTGIIKLFINGTLETTSGSTGNANRTLSSNSTLKIGAGDDGGFTFGGNIGSVFGYNAVLTNEQVLQNYYATMDTYGYTSPDFTAPTFTSGNSFTVDENTPISGTAASISISESATVSISGGVDSAAFNIYMTDTNTAVIKFKTSPNFEGPIDSGGNNIYDLILTATDGSDNQGTQLITITVTNLVETSFFNSFTVLGAPTYRQSIVITLDVSELSRVTIRQNGKVVPGCKNRITAGSSPSNIFSCTWRPSTRGYVTLTASAIPTDISIAASSSIPIKLFVQNRSGSRNG